MRRAKSEMINTVLVSTPTVKFETPVVIEKRRFCNGSELMKINGLFKSLAKSSVVI
jgi:hypothetical protein